MEVSNYKTFLALDEDGLERILNAKVATSVDDYAWLFVIVRRISRHEYHLLWFSI